MELPLPSPYPDELLYSVFSRWKIQKGALKEDISIELFGREVRPSIGLPKGLSMIIKRLPSLVTIEEIIKDHTLYPYYIMLKNFNLRDILYWSTNVDLQENRKRTLLCCPICIRNDMEKYGEAYWHRVHHLPGVRVCPEHNILLLQWCPVCKVRIVSDYDFLRYCFTPTHCANGHSLLNERKNDNEHLLYIAEQNLFVFLMGKFKLGNFFTAVYENLTHLIVKDCINDFQRKFPEKVYELYSTSEDFHRITTKFLIQRLIDCNGENCLKELNASKIAELNEIRDYNLLFDNETYIPTLQRLFASEFFLRNLWGTINKIFIDTTNNVVLDEVAATSVPMLPIIP